MASRYFLDHPPDGNHVTLGGTEAHHLIHVMRAQVGNPCVLFDGSGFEFHSRITQIHRKEVSLEILTRIECRRELPLPIRLAVALPKGERQKYLIEKAVELGVHTLHPLQSQHCNWAADQKTVTRLQRAVIEACKQCGRNHLMKIGPSTTWQQLLETNAADVIRLVAHPSGSSDLPAAVGTMPCLVAVGPEGGFSDDEVKQATQAGWQSWSLGPRILRVETAAAACAAILGYLSADGR